MADNVPITPGSGATVRTVDRAGIESQVMVLDVGGAAAESLITSTNGMPVRDAPTATSGGPTATASTTLFTADTTGFQSVTVQLTGAFMGGVQFFTSNDNTNFVPVIGLPVDDNLSEVDTLYAPGLIRIPAVGRYIRAVTTALFVGSVSWSVYLRQQPVQVDPTIGITADPNIPLPMGGKDATGMSRMLLTGADGGLQLTDSAVYSIVLNQTTGPNSFAVFDTTGFQSIVLQTRAQWSANFAAESSNDQVIWLPVPVATMSSTGVTMADGSGVSGSPNTLYVIPVIGRWFRIRMTVFGAISPATVYLRSVPSPWAMPTVAAVAFRQSVNVGQINAITPLMGNGVTGTGSQRVTIASDNTPHGINPRAATTGGGLSAFRIVTGTTGFIKASAGQLYSLDVYNVNAAVRYLHIYNKASAPTLSTDTPVYTIPLPPTAGRSVTIGQDIGLAFATGIAWAYTTDNIAIPATAATSAEGFFSGTFA